MCNNEEKGKSYEDFIEFYVLLESYEYRTIKGDTLGELVKCKTSKSTIPPKNSYQTRHIRPPELDSRDSD
jgi:hypothetical protein